MKKYLPLIAAALMCLCLLTDSPRVEAYEMEVAECTEEAVPQLHDPQDDSF